MKDGKDLTPKLTVVGVGGAGSNAVNNMVRSGLKGVNFVVCNTDAQALKESQAEVRVQLGLEITQGLGAGSRPDVGRASAEESLDEVLSHLKGSNMIFVTAGMGGGTGTGGAPVIAKAAQEAGILTVGVVTRPFHFEGSKRMQTAEEGIEVMRQCVDTLLVIPNQNLFRLVTEQTTFSDAFAMADDVLYSGVRTFTDLMIKHGLINLDFADICAVMREMKGKAMMGTGQAGGERRAIDAAEQAISCPLLDSDITMKGARAVLINITGGPDMTLIEVEEAANRVREEVDPNANIIFGATFDEALDGELRVAVVATGIDAKDKDAYEPVDASRPPITSSREDEGMYAFGPSPVEAPEELPEEVRPGLSSINKKEELGRSHDLFSEVIPFQDTPRGEAGRDFLSDKPSPSWPSDEGEEGAASEAPEASQTKRRAFSLLERLGMRRQSAKKEAAVPDAPVAPAPSSGGAEPAQDMAVDEDDMPAFMRQKKR
ncbi:cell division protein FtsZ [bacterium NHP-B]|nr:cell division protein FtsZ [bacterium NHP-B]